MRRRNKRASFRKQRVAVKKKEQKESFSGLCIVTLALYSRGTCVTGFCGIRVAGDFTQLLSTPLKIEEKEDHAEEDDRLCAPIMWYGQSLSASPTSTRRKSNGVGAQ